MSLDSLIANTIRPDVRSDKSYHVPDASGFVKLDAMENPYQLPEDLRRELANRLAEVAHDHRESSARLALACALTLPDQVVRSALASDWKRKALSQHLPLDKPTVFLFGR